MTTDHKEPHWFEKTVEYAFVMKYARHLRLASPLDGDHERAADAIFAIQNAKWLLIEFKRGSSNLRSEESKYSAYEEAKDALSEESKGMHFFVYGLLPPHNNNELELIAAPYWQQTPPLSIKDLLNNEGSDDPQVFWQYIEKLVAKKSSGKGGAGGPDFSFIAAVTDGGHIQTVSSLSEVFPNGPTPEPTFEHHP
jgi:hypothetical protein